METREFTAVYKKSGKFYVAWIEEIPGVNTQGRTKKEVRDNLREALSLVIDSNRKISKKERGASLFRESIEIPVPTAR